jgi:Domain of unknown function (DUF4383)
MARPVALIFGIIYTLVGIIGFIPSLGGTSGMAPSYVLHIFSINVVHNVIHLVIGIWALSVAGNQQQASGFLRAFGYILILLAIVGFFWPNPFGVVPIGGPDVWLHLVTGIIFLWAGLSVPKPVVES